MEQVEGMPPVAADAHPDANAVESEAERLARLQALRVDGLRERRRAVLVPLGILVGIALLFAAQGAVADRAASAIESGSTWQPLACDQSLVVRLSADVDDVYAIGVAPTPGVCTFGASINLGDAPGPLPAPRVRRLVIPLSPEHGLGGSVTVRRVTVQALAGYGVPDQGAPILEATTGHRGGLVHDRSQRTTAVVLPDRIPDGGWFVTVELATGERPERCAPGVGTGRVFPGPITLETSVLGRRRHVEVLDGFPVAFKACATEVDDWIKVQPALMP